MPDLTHGTLADLYTLMSHPPYQRCGHTWILKGQPNPAAGGGFTYTVPPEWWIRILSATFTLATDATGSARNLAVNYLDADGTLLDTNPALLAVNPSSTVAFVADQQVAATPSTYRTFDYRGTAAAPAALTNLATSVSLPPGSYQVQWQVELAGTLASPADTDNVQLVAGGAARAQALAPAVAGVYAQTTTTVFLSAAGTIVLQSIGAASAGTTYTVKMTITPYGSYPVQVQLPDMTMKSGWQFQLALTSPGPADQLSGMVLVAERYPSNWADGSLDADEERILRHLARLLAGEARRM